MTAAEIMKCYGYLEPFSHSIFSHPVFGAGQVVIMASLGRDLEDTTDTGDTGMEEL